MALIFNTVDQGSRRIGVRSNNQDFAGTGFVTPRGKLVVVGHAQAALPVAISGLRAGRYQLTVVGTDGRVGKRPMLVPTTGEVKLKVATGATFSFMEE